ncbi:MAG: KH domain-containing protein [Promethearchaeota archaeon]
MKRKEKKQNKDEKDKVAIKLKTSRPVLVIGKGGKRIQEIKDVLQDRFGLEMPQIEVEEVAEPDLDPQIMAERLVYSLDKGRNYKRAAYYILRKIMNAGALEADIIILFNSETQKINTHKFHAERNLKIIYLEDQNQEKGVAVCIQNSEISGVLVKITQINFKLEDDLTRIQTDYLIEEEEGVLYEEDKKLFDEFDK